MAENAEEPRGRHFEHYSASIVIRPDTGEVLAGPGAVAKLPLPEPIFVVTAHNPGGRRHSQAHNKTAQERLTSWVRNSGLQSLSADGSSLDGSWTEAGHGLSGISRLDAVCLAQEFGQDGIFELTERSVKVIAVAGPTVVSSRPRNHDDRQ